MAADWTNSGRPSYGEEPQYHHSAAPYQAPREQSDGLNNHDSDRLLDSAAVAKEMYPPAEGEERLEILTKNVKKLERALMFVIVLLVIALLFGSAALGVSLYLVLADEQVSTDDIAAGAVTREKIGYQAVTSDNIGYQAVTSDKIGYQAVTSDNIGYQAVTSDKIGYQAVTSDKIATSAVTSDKIASSAVTSGKIATSAVTSDKIASSAVTSTKIASSVNLYAPYFYGSSDSSYFRVFYDGLDLAFYSPGINDYIGTSSYPIWYGYFQNIYESETWTRGLERLNGSAVVTTDNEAVAKRFSGLVLDQTATGEVRLVAENIAEIFPTAVKREVPKTIGDEDESGAKVQLKEEIFVNRAVVYDAAMATIQYLLEERQKMREDIDALLAERGK